MGVLAPVGNRLRRILFNRNVFIGLVIVYGLMFIFLSPSSPWAYEVRFFGQNNLQTSAASSSRRRMTNHPPLPALKPRVPCYGPRGKLLSESPDDELEEVNLNIPFPKPWTGSYEALNLTQTWSTAQGRYGAYGFGETANSYNRSRVDWDKINWQDLQTQCLHRNAHRFPLAALTTNNSSLLQMPPRFSYPNESKIHNLAPQWHEFGATRRTALVVRTWRGYAYKDEDMHYIRSLIVEASLRTGGEYQVILLVDMHNHPVDILASKENYLEALRVDAGVPKEFLGMAVLWDSQLLKSWYPDIKEHRTIFQVYQPTQLFALHYPEFDHYWQLELDMRITSDAGAFLDQLSEFARMEPRKQSLERAMFQHMQPRIGDYESFVSAVDAANNGSTHAWGPLRLPDIDPIGPEPPTADPRDDNFKWGVGEDADVIVTSYCTNASVAYHWQYRNWIHGFQTGKKTPMIFCPPAIMRSSRNALLVIHEAQHVQALRIPSEATPPSFALWHGLKLSFPQHPVFYWAKNGAEDEFQDAWWKGGPKNSSTGAGPDVTDHPRGWGLSYWWQSVWSRQLYDAWEGRQLAEDVGFPWILAKPEEADGKVYMPSNLMMHPIKHHT
ncbi:hypothetical protein B0H66DRAFT_485505 [Apodospora peruviana]|uniref:Uncharacterized protein n=1 Tax=Apodospora peruviana TaxID=516989 RepID=A0AAE0LYZ1_9PEZI|nr:hypothetical protein B0H66DRAFT_485505 [Apodospora peruviana]